MNEKNIKTKDICCDETVCDTPVICNCQGLCMCEYFVCDAEIFACQDCCCDEEN